ncbi:helix-loop-helix DNA-binding domain-containing protein [Ditylenchus destructor]|nr:helix-loop-helix DNA-binding domain-containing protein [Ditylenchus destructor]
MVLFPDKRQNQKISSAPNSTSPLQTRNATANGAIITCNFENSSLESNRQCDMRTNIDVNSTSPTNFFTQQSPTSNLNENMSNGIMQNQNPGGKKFISPFDPEAKIPLPFQLDELGNLGTTVWKRNERERYRVRCVNEGYEKLRSHLPLAESEKRLSKVDTLRLAIYYIRHLDHLLNDNNHNLVCDCFETFGNEENILNK